MTTNKRKHISILVNRFSSFMCLCLIVIVIFASNVYAQVNIPASYPDRIILNPGVKASKSISVTWRTSTDIDNGSCMLQKISDTRINPNASETFKAKTKTITYKHGNEPAVSSNHHSYTFSNLEEGASYLYRVGIEGFWSEWLEFQMPGRAEDKISFLYFGDPQNDIKSQWSRIVRKAYQHNPNCDFMLYAGDIINTAGSDVQWDEWFKAGTFIYGSVPQIFTPGNHDYDDYTLDPHWNAQFTQPHNGPNGLEGTCFFVDYKNLRLISFDTAVEGELENEDGYALLSQKAWLDSVLTTNTKEWVIVTTHLPFYSPKESRDNNIIRKHFQPILEKHNVDMVLSGHDHSYGRGTASDTPGEDASIIYVVSVSGPKLYDAGDKNWMQHKGSKIQLFQNIKIDGNELEYEAYTAGGDLFDKLTLKKRKNKKNKIIDQKPNIN